MVPALVRQRSLAHTGEAGGTCLMLRLVLSSHSVGLGGWTPICRPGDKPFAHGAISRGVSCTFEDKEPIHLSRLVVK